MFCEKHVLNARKLKGRMLFLYRSEKCAITLQFQTYFLSLSLSLSLYFFLMKPHNFLNFLNIKADEKLNPFLRRDF